MEKPRAVLFDAYGTLFDVYSVGLLAQQLLVPSAFGARMPDKMVTQYASLLLERRKGAIGGYKLAECSLARLDADDSIAAAVSRLQLWK